MFFICIQKYDSKSSSLEFNVFYARYSRQTTIKFEKLVLMSVLRFYIWYKECSNFSMQPPSPHAMNQNCSRQEQTLNNLDNLLILVKTRFQLIGTHNPLKSFDIRLVVQILSLQFVFVFEGPYMEGPRTWVRKI